MRFKYAFVFVLCLFISSSVFGEMVKHIELCVDGTLKIDGRKTFVYGAYRDPSDDWRKFDGIKEAGFNLTHDYYFEGCNDIDVYLRDAKEYLDLAEKAGVGVFLGLPRKTVKQGDIKSIKRIVSSLQNKPALWFWYLYDEPARSGFSPVVLRKIYEAVKSVDRQHPIVLVDNCKFDSQVYAACDMIWTDRYPAPYGILPVLEVMEQARSAWPDKVIWSVPHAHSYLEMQRNPERFRGAEHLHRPNGKEIKAMLHCGLAGGARGILIYWYPGTKMRKRRPKAWGAMVESGKLFHRLNDVLVASWPKVPARLKVEWKTRYERLYEVYKTTKGPYKKERCEVVAWQRMYKGKLYVGLVNAGYQPRVRVELTVPYKFRQVVQYPGGEPVITVEKGGKWQADQEKIPVAILDVIQGQTLRLQMNECDVVIWRFDGENKNE